MKLKRSLFTPTACQKKSKASLEEDSVNQSVTKCQDQTTENEERK